MEHIWHQKIFGSMNLKCCMNCGFLMNYDKPNKDCPGPVFVDIRNEEAQDAIEGRTRFIRPSVKRSKGE